MSDVRALGMFRDQRSEVTSCWSLQAVCVFGHSNSTHILCVFILQISFTIFPGYYILMFWESVDFSVIAQLHIHVFPAGYDMI